MTIIKGKCSTFGGPGDTGMQINEDVALVNRAEAEHSGRWREYFSQPLRAWGLGRQLKPTAFYCAMRWDYHRMGGVLGVRNVKVVVEANGRSVQVQPLDWGPNERTGRVIDLSPGAAKFLGVVTDDVVAVLIGG